MEMAEGGDETCVRVFFVIFSFYEIRQGESINQSINQKSDKASTSSETVLCQPFIKRFQQHIEITFHGFFS